MKNIYIALFAISFFLIVVPGISNFDVASSHLYILIALMMVDFAKSRSISFFTIWITAFVYIILSEMVLYRNSAEYTWSIRYLLSANNVVLISYLRTSPKISLLKSDFNSTYMCKNSKLFVVLIVIMYVLYITNTFNRVLNNYIGARRLVNAMGSGSFFGTLIGSFGLVLPSLIGYYVVRIKKGSKWIALLLSMPIFFFLLVLATRFKMLFSIAPFFMVTDFIRLKSLNKKSIAYSAFIGISLIFITNSVKDNRASSFIEVLTNIDEVDDNSRSTESGFAVSVCRRCSPEGIVNMTQLADKYFENHDLKYGECSGMIFYFWVPRAIWKDKPTQLDYWMPRYFYKNLDDSFTTASGFTGEVRADFGLFSYLFMILFGFMLKKANTLLVISDYGRKASYTTIYATMLIPYFFFFVRSPLTSSYNLIFEIFTIYIIGKLCFAKENTYKRISNNN